ncbi:MAG: DUF1761 domain-containing protein [Bdellovibrionota bacterium]
MTKVRYPKGMQQPNLIFNWPAIGVAIVTAFIFGGLWYGPILGKKWAKLMGMSMEDCKPDPKGMRKMLAIQLFGTFLTTYVLAHSVQVWRPSVWGVGADGSDAMYGFFCGLFTWLGFYIPLQLGKVAWEQRPWTLFLINTGHDFINLQILSQILAHWR